MRLVSFCTEDRESYGALVAGGIVDLGAALGGRYRDLRALLAAGALDAARGAASRTAADVDPDAVEWLPVIPNPAKIFCIGINYESHRIETGRDETRHPTVFTRFADTLAGHRQPIVRPRASDKLDFEGELAVVIGRPGRRIARADAMQHIAGYSCFNDATLRDFQRHTSQFTPGKNFPLTAGFGPCLVTADAVDDVHSLSIRTTLNGDLMQDAGTDRLIFDVPALIEYISAFTPLAPGDVISTGTPGGVGFKREPPLYMRPGDEVTVEIEAVGRLVNRVVAE